MYIRIVEESGKIVAPTFHTDRMPAAGEIFDKVWIVSEKPVCNSFEQITPAHRAMVGTITVRQLDAADKNSPRDRPKVMEPKNGGAVVTGRDSKRSSKRIDE